MSYNLPSAVSAPTRLGLQKKARNWIFVAIPATLISLPAFYFVEPIFFWIVRLNGVDFGFASFAFGLVLALGPVLAMLGLLMALFWRVEASFTAEPHQITPFDTLAIVAGLIVSFSPALVAFYPPVKAIVTGFIGFRGPGQQYFRVEDPYGFWQATGFWLMGAATLAILAGFYWRAKWRALRIRAKQWSVDT